jgi:hypothetical protein
LIGFLSGTSVKEQEADVPLKFTNFMKNEKETVKMSICGVLPDEILFFRLWQIES